MSNTRLALWRRWIVLALGVFGALHLSSIVFFAFQPSPPKESAPIRKPLNRDEQVLVSALTRVLAEDGVASADRWAEAILRASPSKDLGYLAMITAQIRRESHFLSKDIEWLFDRMVPDLMHEWGVPDPVNTVGPMQVRRWHLREIFERTLGRRVEFHEVKELAGTIEIGVAGCVAVLDSIAVQYFPDRKIRGWADAPARLGFNPPGADNLASQWQQPDVELRRSYAVLQKMLGDVTGTPLALDGIPGNKTIEILRLFGLALEESNQPHFLEALDGIPEITTAEQLRKDLVFRTIAKAWQRRFELLPPDRIFPRISYDPRLSFVFADFNSGKGSCRLAATQALMAIVLATEVEADGKMGPQTRAAMADLFDKFVIDESRKKEFQELLRTKNKPVWVSTQARSLAQKVYRANTGMVPPNHLVPNLWHGRLRQQMKGGSRLVSVEGYVSGSVSFFEDYYLRLATYTGRQVERPPSAAPRH